MFNCHRTKLKFATPLLGLALLLLLWQLDIRPGLLMPEALQPTQVEGSAFPLIITDAVGEKITLPSAPQRIVSATLSSDEMLSALVTPERISAVTYLADNPAISNVADFYPDSVQRISGEVEEIIAQQPDLVFISPYSRAETVRLLLNTHIPVVRQTQFNSLADIAENLRMLAAVTGTSAKAEQLLAQQERQLQQLQQQLAGKARPRVLFYNLSGSSTGTGSPIDEMIHLSGGYNVLRDTGIRGSQTINEEFAIGLQPEIILMSGWNSSDDFSPAEQLKQRSAWQNVPAIKNQRVYDLKGNWLFAISQFSWLGIHEMAAILHPELVAKRGTQP